MRVLANLCLMGPSVLLSDPVVTSVLAATLTANMTRAAMKLPERL